MPVLLLQNGGLVKTIRFREARYIGDPVNAVKIFNDKEADEIVVLDITATAQGRSPGLAKIKEIATEAFMPFAYGGGIRTTGEIKKILESGVEKAVINSAAVEVPDLISKAAALFGSQSIVVSIDVKKNMFGKHTVYTHCGKKNTGLDPLEFAAKMERAGAGELFLNSIDRDGTFSGYDEALLAKICGGTSIPVIACGGARNMDDFVSAVKNCGASAVAAGSIFVYQGRQRAVLISFPSPAELESRLYRRLE